MNIQIIKASLGDNVALQTIGKTTFIETFAEHNTSENLEQYLSKSFSIDKINAELGNQNSEIYFATIDKEVIGYLKVNFETAQTELQDNTALEIERIYVLKQYQKQRIGQLLFEYAVSIAKAKKLNYIWLGVWEKNTKALNFYVKNGFVAFDKHVFVLGNDEQTDIMMKLVL